MLRDVVGFVLKVIDWFMHGLVNRFVGRFVVGFVVVVGVTLVLDISYVSGVAIHVIGDNLTATVGEIDKVLSLGVVSVTVLVVTEVEVSVVILDGVVEVVVSGSLSRKGVMNIFDGFRIVSKIEAYIVVFLVFVSLMRGISWFVIVSSGRSSSSESHNAHKNSNDLLIPNA